VVLEAFNHETLELHESNYKQKRPSSSVASGTYIANLFAVTQQIWQCFLKWRRAKSYFKNLEIEPVYTGEGVKQGASEQAILTWTVPGKSQARIVYGDLSIKDADSVPDTQAADDTSNPGSDFSSP
jgi:hypothetical protein